MLESVGLLYRLLDELPEDDVSQVCGELMHYDVGAWLFVRLGEEGEGGEIPIGGILHAEVLLLRKPMLIHQVMDAIGVDRSFNLT